MKTKEELIQSYVDLEKQRRSINEEQSNVIKELSGLSGHKVGEIIKWTEKGRTKRTGGSIWRPEYIQLPDKERKAVLTRIEPHIYIYGDKTNFSFLYYFKPVKADGGVSTNRVIPRDDYEWTGEIHKDYINK